MGNILSFLPEVSAREPTWARACELVQSVLKLNPCINQLLRACWNGNVETREFIKMLGFTRLNLTALVDAAGFLATNTTLDAALLERSLQNLGVRLCAVILGINYACQVVIASKPPPVWRKLFQELMTTVEIGYRVGSKTSLLGVEGGALIGFSKFSGDLFLVASDPNKYKQWVINYKRDPQAAIDLFGCESYQVSAFLLQQLGFGHEIAAGAAVGYGNIDARFINIDEKTMIWKAAVLWIDALKEGRNYPASPEMRQVFREIAPPKDQNQKNHTLETLWAEIAKTRAEGSKWTWHLPKPDYDQVAAMIANKNS